MRYKKILDKIEYSFSTLHLYEQCPYAFYLKKICQKEGVDNAYAEIGSFAHKLNEKIFKKEITPQEALTECAEEFENQVLCYLPEKTKEKKYEELCDYFAGFDEKYQEKFEVISVEEKFQWKIGKYKCVGFADLILKHKKTGEIWLIDHKSSKKFLKKNGEPYKNQEENFKAYSRQMYMYADAIKNKYGFFPDYIVWSHFLNNGEITKIKFDKKQQELALKWVLDTISNIYKDKLFEANSSYMMCNVLCNYRDNECEYREEE